MPLAAVHVSGGHLHDLLLLVHVALGHWHVLLGFQVELCGVRVAAAHPLDRPCRKSPLLSAQSLGNANVRARLLMLQQVCYGQHSGLLLHIA